MGRGVLTIGLEMHWIWAKKRSTGVKRVGLLAGVHSLLFENVYIIF